jgi:hypothetical protein
MADESPTDSTLPVEPVETLEFQRPKRADETGEIIPHEHDTIPVEGPTEWVSHLHECLVRMEGDLVLGSTLPPTAKGQTIQAYNALADRMEEVYEILHQAEDDAEDRIHQMFPGILAQVSRFTMDLYMNLANAKRRATDKMELLATLQQRQQGIALANERYAATMGDRELPAPPQEATQPETTATRPPITPQDPSWVVAERFLDELRPLLVTRKETARRPMMKAPETFDGSATKLRSWWELVKDYMEIHQPTMPTESIQVKFVGSLLREEARRWYDTRKRSLERQGNEDSWRLFAEALLYRFTDRQQKRRDHDEIKKLKYEGSIQDFLSRLEELNSTVRLTGSALQDIVLAQITPEMGRAIYHKMGTIPEDDDILIETVREAGVIEEEILRTQARMKGTANRKVPTDPPTKAATPTSQAQRGRPETPGQPGRGRRAERRPATEAAPAAGAAQPDKPVVKDFSHLTRVWERRREAYQGVNQEEVDAHRKLGKDCSRCGQNGHLDIHCKVGKTLEGTPLPPYPGKKVTAAAKRKQPDENDAEEPPAKKPETARSAAIIASASKRPIWVDSDSDESDF